MPAISCSYFTLLRWVAAAITVLLALALSASAADPYAKTVIFSKILTGNAGNQNQNPTNALGAPNAQIVSMGGPGASIVLDMGLDGLVVDGAGADLEIREIGTAGGGVDESYRVLVSNSTDTNTFVFVGVGRALSLIDIQSAGLASARYVWLQDIATETLNDPQTPGSDIDSLRSLHYAGGGSVPPPGSVQARLTGQGVWLSWLPSPGTNITGYAIRRSLDGAMFNSTPDAIVSAQESAWHDLNPPPPTNKFYYAVSAIAAGDDSILVLDDVASSQLPMLTNQTVHVGDDVLAGWPNPQTNLTLTFVLPDFAGGPRAELAFELFDVDFTSQTVLLNGGAVGNLPTQPSESWLPRTLGFPAGALQPGVNTLQFSCRNSSGGVTGNLDDFQLRNVWLRLYGDQNQINLFTRVRFTQVAAGQTNVTLHWVVEQTPTLSPIDWQAVSDPIPWTGVLTPTNGYFRLHSAP